MAGRARGGDGTGREEKRGRDCTGDLAEGARVGVSAATLEPAVVQRLGVDTSAQSQPLLPGPVLRRIGDPSASGAPSDTSTVFWPFFVLRPADAGLRARFPRFCLPCLPALCSPGAAGCLGLSHRRSLDGHPNYAPVPPGGTCATPPLQV